MATPSSAGNVKPPSMYDAAVSRNQKRRQQELLVRMEQLADTLCEQYLHVAQDITTESLKQQNAPPPGAPPPSQALPLEFIRQQIEQMHFGIEQQHHKAILSGQRKQDDYLESGLPSTEGRTVMQQPPVPERVGGGQLLRSNGDQPGIGPSCSSSTSGPLLPPVLQSQRLLPTKFGGGNPETFVTGLSRVTKVFSNAATIPQAVHDPVIFDDTARGRLQAAHQRRLHEAAVVKGRGIAASPRRPAQPRGMSGDRVTGRDVIAWTSEVRRGGDAASEANPPLLHVPNYNAVRAMLSDDHGLTVGHIQPLLGSMEGHTFRMLDCMMDGNTRQLSSRRPGNLSEVERRLRVVPEVTLGPSKRELCSSTSRSQLQQERERATAVASLMMTMQDRANSNAAPSVMVPTPPPPRGGKGSSCQSDMLEDWSKEERAPKCSPRDLVASLAAQRFQHRL